MINALSPAVFLDRDGTIMEDCDYCSDPKDVRIFSGVPEALRSLKSRGFKLIVITNQSGIGRGLMTNPDCLIMDEPTEGLAPIIIQSLWEAIGKLKEQGLSILLVEQNAHLALKLVDYVHVMSKGQVVYSGRPQELSANEDIKSRFLGI